MRCRLVCQVEGGGNLKTERSANTAISVASQEGKERGYTSQSVVMAVHKARETRHGVQKKSSSN